MSCLLNIMTTEYPKQNFQKYDWEAIIFPIVVTDLKSITNHYRLPSDSKLEIYRDENFHLKGVLKGIKVSPEEFYYYENDTIKKVGFIQDETLEAKSILDNVSYLIQGFGLYNFSETPFIFNDIPHYEYKCDVYIESIKQIDNSNNLSPNIVCDYFLCSLPEILFNGITKRIKNSPQYKYRTKFDKYEESDGDLRRGYSSSWDYSVLNFENQTIIIQRISKDFLPKEIDGILVEYRNLSNDFLSKKFRKIVQEYLSFILGSHLQKICTSSFLNNYELIETHSYNPWSKKLMKNRNISPIPLKNGYDREFFERMLNTLFQNFLIQYDNISISNCLWKLWIGSNLPIGTNLPILSSGLETLIDSYLEYNGCIKKYNKVEKKKYSDTIKEELNSLEIKLNDYTFKSSVINKLKNPFNLGVGEKMKLFFNELDLKFEKDSIENKALLARNLMAHQETDYETEKELHQIIKLSDAYLTLINRVILKILEYEWYYIDYSKEGIKYLKMDENL